MKNRIEEALALKGMRQTDLSESTGISKQSINNWVKHRWEPKPDAVQAMACVLEVSPAWLAGY